MSSLEIPDDLRVRRTHKLLWEALMSLMNEQDFEKITVTDICERAMVHRTTFYKHYEDKYNLFLVGMRHMHNEFVRKMLADEERKDALDDSWLDFTYILIHVAEYQRFYKTVLCGDRMGSFYSLMRNYLMERCEKKVRHMEKTGTVFSIPSIVIAQFWAGTMISSITWWLENDQPYPPEQMGQYMGHLFDQRISASRNG